jgi:aerobic carbon-monoxide dehydrogenase medium subunit
MNRFELAEPATLTEALALLDPDDPAVRVIAGGTALVLMMKARLFQPTRLVSLRRLGGGRNGALRGMRLDERGGWRIGAMTPLAELEYSPQIATALPVINRALRTLSNIRIRNVATIGGHLAHGDPHMDLPPILLTLGARLHAASRRGERCLEIGDFFTGYYQTALHRDELITELEIPPQPAGVHAWYEKYTALSADDWPAVGVAVWFRLDSGSIAEARIAVSAATDRPLRLPGPEAVLTHAPPTAELFARASDAAAAEVEPLADIRGTAAYKREMVRVHVRRALEQALRSPAADRRGKG